MSGLTTAEMSKITVAGTLEELNSTLELAARLSAIHIIDYNGDELGIGTPDSSADKISNRLAIMRSCMSTLGSSPSDEIIPKAKMQDSLKSTLSDSINIVTADIVRLEEINSNLENIHAEISTLKKLAPLGLDIELMSGYESLNTYVGSVANLAATATELKAATADIIIFANPNEGKTGTVAVFCEAELGDEISQILSRQGFEALQLPEETGSPKSLLKTLTGEIGGLQSEAENIELSLENWNAENGGLLVGGIEVLEREFDIKTAPVRVATSDHAFILEGWVLTDQARIVTAALSEVATYAEHTPFERPHGRGHHFDHESEVELPPIAFQNIESAKPYELLTDAVGRPKYGRIDPTTFMFITYPIFFGMMLGDIAYGIAIVAIAWWISAKFSRNELVQQASKLLIYIGFSTIIFGYLFGEFAGFEYLPHGECDISGIVGVAQCEAAGGSYHWAHAHAPKWVTWMAALYPSGGEMHWMWTGPFGFTLAFPFHRVSSNINDLIVLTIYLGVLHLALGMLIGFRDVLKEHGMVAAIFEKGSWLLVLSGGFLFIYAFIVSPKHSDEDYLALLEQLSTIGFSIMAIGIVMVVIMLWKYEGIPLPIAIGLGPLESLQILSNTISYVRLFAVGIVGVKIAETGNHMFYEPMAHTLANFSSAGMADMVLIPIFLIGWLAVQIFALGLGMFSPNVQAARLHFVEWMGKFYETGGEPFAPFGKKLVNVEAD